MLKAGSGLGTLMLDYVSEGTLIADDRLGCLAEFKSSVGSARAALTFGAELSGDLYPQSIDAGLLLTRCWGVVSSTS
jgi:hypothetical protein